GSSMKRAAEVVRDSVGIYPLDNLPATLKAIGHILQREMGGSSGPLYGVFFLRCGSVLENSNRTGLAQWAEVLDQCCRAIIELGGAEPSIVSVHAPLPPVGVTLAFDTHSRRLAWDSPGARISDIDHLSLRPLP